MEEQVVKMLMISGSRNPAGQTARAADAMLDGAAEGGCETEKVFLPELTIERCRQCDNDGWGICLREGRCVIEDDAASIVDKIRSADVLVFATPVYFSDLSESLRAFMERLRRICRHEEGRNMIAGKPAVGLCVAGGGGGGAPVCCVTLEDVLATCGFDVVDMIPVRRQNLALKLPRLRQAGAWLAEKPGS